MSNLFTPLILLINGAILIVLEVLNYKREKELKKMAEAEKEWTEIKEQWKKL